MTAPALPLTEPSTATVPTTPRADTRRFVSPAYGRYLQSQEVAIRLKGGHDGDVRQFMRTELNAPPTLGADEQPVVTAGSIDPRVPPYLQGMSMAVLQGATAGWGDEAVGWYRGKLSGLDGETDLYRREYEAWGNANPKARTALEIAGAALPTRLTGIGYAGSAAYGGAAGAGYTDNGTLGERTVAAVTGAVVAPVLTGVMRGLGVVLEPIVRPIAEKVLPAPVARLFGITPEQRARERLARAFALDGFSDPAKVLTRATDLQRTGVPATVAEVGGDAVNALIQDASKQISPIKSIGRAAFRQRQEATGERLTSQFAAAISENPKFASANAHEVKEQLLQSASDAVRPLYTDAYQQHVDLSPRLMKLLDKYATLRESFNRAATRAGTIDDAIVGQELRGMPVTFTPGLRVEKLSDDIGISPQTLMQRFPNLRIDAARAMLNQLTPSSRVPLRAIDLMKHELDDMIESEVANNPVNKFASPRQIKQLAREHGKALMEFRDEFVSEARKQVPSYDHALTLFGGAKDAEDAIDFGLQLFRMRPDQIAKGVGARSPIMRGFVRVGALQAYGEKVAARDGSANIARQLFGGQLHATDAKGIARSIQAQRIYALWPDTPDVADDFLRAASGEALASYRAGHILRRPGASAVKKGEQLLEGQVPSVRGTPVVAAASAARQQIVRARDQMSQAEADEIMHLAIKGLKNPGDLHTLIQSAFAERPTALRQVMRGAKAGAVGTAAGHIASSPKLPF